MRHPNPFVPSTTFRILARSLIIPFLAGVFLTTCYAFDPLAASQSSLLSHRAVLAWLVPASGGQEAVPAPEPQKESEKPKKAKKTDKKEKAKKKSKPPAQATVPEGEPTHNPPSL
jgi:outer membrane biosynthesis protein TonB